MDNQLLLVIALLLTCMALFVSNKPRMDVVALAVIVTLPLLGILSVEETLAGFSNPSVLLIAAMFVVGDGLIRTGIAYRLGDRLVHYAGDSETRLIALLMLMVAGMGSVMSSTGIVAIFIPVVLGICARTRISPSTLMMPLSFAGLMSGMLTLVATPPNLVVHSELVRAGLDGFSFFSFTPIGLVILLLGVAYMLATRRWLGRNAASKGSEEDRHTLASLADRYRLRERERRLRVLAYSSLLHKPLDELELRRKYGVNIIAVERRQKFRTLLRAATGGTILLPGDILLVDLVRPDEATPDSFTELGLEPMPLEASYYNLHSHELGLAEVSLPPESSLPGRTIQEIGFRSRHKLNVVGLRRHREALPGVLVDEKLQPADTLLIAGEWQHIYRLHGQRSDYLLLSVPSEIDEMAPAARKAPYALGILAFMVMLMVTNAVPHVLAAFISCLLMGAFGCITLNSAYRAIHWPTLLLIVGMLPFALALQQTGGIELAAHALLDTFGEANPRVLLATLFLLTAITGLFISNTATAILMAPVAIATALALEVSPYPFAMIVALAASSAFMTPVSSPVNTLVMEPGRYRFTDFLRVGVPFTLLVMLVSVVLVPLLFPLAPL